MLRIITTSTRAFNWICYVSSAWFILARLSEQEAKLTGRKNGGTQGG